MHIMRFSNRIYFMLSDLGIKLQLCEKTINTLEKLSSVDAFFALTHSYKPVENQGNQLRMCATCFFPEFS